MQAVSDLARPTKVFFLYKFRLMSWQQNRQPAILYPLFCQVADTFMLQQPVAEQVIHLSSSIVGYLEAAAEDAEAAATAACLPRK